MNSKNTYKRNQIDEALWRQFRNGPSMQSDPPAVFRNRIKRLLEIDRDVERFSESSASVRRYAFFDQEPQGRGSEARFSLSNVFMLAVALILLDTGFKQAEIVFLMRHTRAIFEKSHRTIRKYPPSPPDLIAAEDRPGAPVRLIKGKKYADCRVFILLEKIEMTETLSITSGSPTPTSSIQIEPRVVRGIENLTSELDQMGQDFRDVLVLEVAELAVLLEESLQEVPPITRGRG